MEGDQIIYWHEEESRAMIYEQEAKNYVIKILSDAGLKIVGEWKNKQMFDYVIPNGHIEFCVERTGWGQSMIDREAGA
jgi:hypothetical protein